MKRAFTIIEVLVVLTILFTLFAIGYVSVIGIERRAPISATVNTLIADLRSAQTSAMAGIGNNVTVVVSGNSYSVTPPGTVTATPQYIEIAPVGTIVFAKGSGDKTGLASVTVTQTITGEHKTITINQYGAVTAIE